MYCYNITFMMAKINCRALKDEKAGLLDEQGRAGTKVGCAKLLIKKPILSYDRMVFLCLNNATVLGSKI